jgi:cytosine deaminase
MLGVPAAQLEAPFDIWSEALCRADWLRRGPAALPLAAGSPADLVIFTAADRWGFPSRTQPRVVLRQGQALQGHVPTAWTQPSLTTGSPA